MVARFGCTSMALRTTRQQRRGTEKNARWRYQTSVQVYQYLSLIHIYNGIVENFVQLKSWLSKEYGIEFVSETDTEVIAQLIGVFYEGDLEDAVFKAVEKMQGAYGLGVVCADEPDKMIAVRKDSPLIVGLGEGCNFIASDIPAILKHVRKIYLIENNETVVLTANDVRIYNAEHQEVQRDVFNVTWDADAAEKEGYDHFMLKEIHEQPKGIRNTITRRMDDDGKDVYKRQLYGYSVSWLHHKGRNRHHFEYWLDYNEHKKGEVKGMPMPLSLILI